MSYDSTAGAGPSGERFFQVFCRDAVLRGPRPKVTILEKRPRVPMFLFRLLVDTSLRRYVMRPISR